ncbi:hypothetical protein Fot_14693 [Forsythia ovata]|uniref:Uncharacterized protein n=1 Tax=Forsythia ovata TaxID=205694 RepID=A0ABD1W716_9LAMI
MASNGPLLQPIQPQRASAAFAYTEAPELFQCHTIRPSLLHEKCLNNVVRVSIGSRDHFDLFFFNPHVSLATVNVQLDKHIFDVFLENHDRQWKAQEYPPNFVAMWKVEDLLDIFCTLLSISMKSTLAIWRSMTWRKRLSSREMMRGVEQSEGRVFMLVACQV